MKAFLVMLMSIVVVGCRSWTDNNERQHTLEWNIADSQSIARLAGGEWSGKEHSVYVVNSPESYSLRVTLADDKQIDFTDATDVYVNRRRNAISRIKVVEHTDSNAEARARLSAMQMSLPVTQFSSDSQWHEGADSEKQGRSDFTLLHSENDVVPSVFVSIREISQKKNLGWQVTTTLVWSSYLDCDEKIPVSSNSKIRRLRWDLSRSRTLDRLNGCVLMTIHSDRHYYLAAAPRLTVSLYFGGTLRYEIGEVSEVYVDVDKSKIDKLTFVSYGYSQEKAIARVREFHDHWHGEGLVGIEKWKQDSALGSFRDYESVIAKSNSTEHSGAEIKADIFPCCPSPGSGFCTRLEFNLATIEDIEH